MALTPAAIIFITIVLLAIVAAVLYLTLARKKKPDQSDTALSAAPAAAGDELIEQTIELSHLTESRRNAATWRAAFFAGLLVTVLFAFIAIVAVTNSKTVAMLYREDDTTGKILYVGNGDEGAKTGEAAVKKQIADCLTAIRDIPYHDPDLAQRQASLAASYCVATGTPASNDLQTYFAAQNPIKLGKRFTRTVTTIQVSVISPLSYQVVWSEKLRDGSSEPVNTTYRGTITLAAVPKVPDDRLVAMKNAAGVFFGQYDLPWGVLPTQ